MNPFMYVLLIIAATGFWFLLICSPIAKAIGTFLSLLWGEAKENAQDDEEDYYE